MTRVQKTIAYSAIVFGILAVLLAFASSIHVIYYVYTSPAFTTSATATIKGKVRQNKWAGFFSCGSNLTTPIVCPSVHLSVRLSVTKL